MTAQAKAHALHERPSMRRCRKRAQNRRTYVMQEGAHAQEPEGTVKVATGCSVIKQL